MNSDPTSDPYRTHASILLHLNETSPMPRQVAWQDFYEFYTPIIAGFARNFGASPQDIQDVIQDVMLGFYRASPTFVYDPNKGRFRGFLKVCTFRALRARVNGNRRMQTNRFEDFEPESPEVTQAWSQQWDQEILRRAMQAVREDYQEPSRQKTFRAFELYVILGKSSDEVARELQMEVNSVHKAKERITKALRKKIEELDLHHG
jgi:RNA polymerase sigma-70 factor, ECF subfamily